MAQEVRLIYVDANSDPQQVDSAHPMPVSTEDRIRVNEGSMFHVSKLYTNGSEIVDNASVEFLAIWYSLPA